MQFKQGAVVMTSDGQDVGRIDRVVIDPVSKAVTHIVIRKGVLFTEDKVVPINVIASGNEEIVRLSSDVGNVHDLPDYEETHFIAEEDEATGDTAPLYWYPPMGSTAAGLLDYPLPAGP